MTAPAMMHALLETGLVLPGGTVHLLDDDQYSTMIFPEGSIEDAVDALLTVETNKVRRLGIPMLLHTGMPDGRVDTRLLIPGMAPAFFPQPRQHDVRPDIRWDLPIPDRHGLLSTVSRAQQDQKPGIAEFTAGILATKLHADLGLHPYTVQAMELHARCAADAGLWGRACQLYQTAADARHDLGAPRETETANARRAAGTWLRCLHSPLAEGEMAPAVQTAGFTIAHHLTANCPTPARVLSSVLKALEEQLPAIRARSMTISPDPDST